MKRPSLHFLWKSLWTNAYLANSLIYSLIPIKPRWCLILKHWRNVGKPSFCKILHEMPVHDTLRTALSNIYCVLCKSVCWFWILVWTNNWPSSIIIRYVQKMVDANSHDKVANSQPQILYTLYFSQDFIFMNFAKYLAFVKTYPREILLNYNNNVQPGMCACVLCV